MNEVQVPRWEDRTKAAGGCCNSASACILHAQIMAVAMHVCRCPHRRTWLRPGKAQQLLLQCAAPLQRVFELAEGQR